MLTEKKVLNFEELDNQTAMELPAREMPLVTIVITNVLNNLSIDVTVANNEVAVQVCTQILNTRPNLTCEIQ